MIFFVADLPASINQKIALLVDRAKEEYNSDYYDIEKEKWLADKLTIESLFPSWIIAEANANSGSVVLSIVKNYMRWLLSLEHGYGAQLNWELMRSPALMNDIFLEAYADFYFPGANFSSDILKNKLQNLRSFLLKADTNYFNIKGTPDAINYLCCSLLGFSIGSLIVQTCNAGVMRIQIPSANYSDFMNYKTFLEKYAIPAGITVIYESV